MVLQGVAVCPGCLRAESYVLTDLPEFDLQAVSTLSPEETGAIIHEAMETIAGELEARRRSYEAEGNADMADLQQVQAMMLEDSTFLEGIDSAVSEGAAAAAAVLRRGTAQEEMLLSLNDDYMSARAEDIRDLSTRVACRIEGVPYPSLASLPGDRIVVARQLLPSMLMGADLPHIKGIVIGQGTKTSHVSILASGLQIPTVVGCGDVSMIRPGEGIYLDGEKGSVHCSVTPEEAAACDAAIKVWEENQTRLARFADAPLRSADDVTAKLMVNITEPRELGALGNCSIDGVGLFRSEFLFLDRQSLPSEEEQYQAYVSAVRQLGGKPLTIRTIDIGGDKQCDCLNLPKEENPFMGFRAVRICVERHDLILTQLRAILRAAAEGEIQVMFPMIATRWELTEMLDLLKQAAAQLTEAGIPHRDSIKTGIMVEIPSAVVMLDQLMPLIDFVSIGSNDLVQYTYAADRLNPKVSYLNQFMHPAALRLISHTILQAEKYHTECSLCGEMAGDRIGFAALAILGLKKFSVSASKLLRTKSSLAMLNLAELAPLREKLLNAQSASDAVALLRQALPAEYFA